MLPAIVHFCDWPSLSIHYNNRQILCSHLLEGVTRLCMSINFKIGSEEYLKVLQYITSAQSITTQFKRLTK